MWAGEPLSSIVATGYSEAQVAQGILKASVRIKRVGVGNRSEKRLETALLDTRGSKQRNCVPEAGNRCCPTTLSHRVLNPERCILRFGATNKLNRNSQ